MYKEKFIDGTWLTGFPLQHATVEELLARWSIISNNFSDNPRQREINILAYKVTNVQRGRGRHCADHTPKIDVNAVHFSTGCFPLSFYLWHRVPLVWCRSDAASRQPAVADERAGSGDRHHPRALYRFFTRRSSAKPISAPRNAELESPE